MFCAKCGAPLHDEAVFCPKCGNKRAVENGGNEIVKSDVATPAEAVVDKPVEDAPLTQEDETPAKSIFVYQILALFLGSLGVHNFYAKRFPRAIGQLALTIVFFGCLLCKVQNEFVLPTLLIILWLWSITDIFTIRSDGAGRPFGDGCFRVVIDPVDEQAQSVLFQYRLNSRRCVFAIFFGLILALLIIGMITQSKVVISVFMIAFMVALWFAWYYYAKSKGYSNKLSVGLAISGFIGTLTLPIGLLLLAITFTIAARKTKASRT